MNPEAERIIALGVAHQVTVSCAESLTGGDVASAMVSIPGASAVLRGGLVAYHSDLKSRLLGVDASELAQGGAVSAAVASAMAEGAADLMGSDYAVATTGVAGPDPDPVSGVEPGVVFIAVAGSGLGTWVRELRYSGSRDEIRVLATRAALQGLRDALSHDYPL